jgi:nucleoid DNA-binding protein
VIAGELAAGRDVAIAGFGKFRVIERAARARAEIPRPVRRSRSPRAAPRNFAAAALKQRLNS